MSNTSAINTTLLQSTVAGLLGLTPNSAVQVCLIPNSGSTSATSTLVTIVLGAPVSVANFGVVTTAVLTGNLLSQLGVTLTQTPTVFAFAASSGVVGDPQFTGFRGQSYQVHGIDGAVYNLITSPELQVNARFTFLESGRCPVINGEDVRSNCWSHPGSYLGEIGMRMRLTEASEEHRLHVQAGDRLVGFTAVSVDGVQLPVGGSVQPAAGMTINRVSSHELRVSTRLFSFELHNSDLFINQAVKANVPIAQLSTHGLLGQTHKRVAMGAGVKQVVEGEVDDYVVAEDTVFGTDCVYNQYY